MPRLFFSYSTFAQIRPIPIRNLSKIPMALSAFCNGDPNSFSNPEKCLVTDISLKLQVDFKKRTFSGFVDLSLDRKDLNANLILDTKDLLIHNVKIKDTFSEIKFHLAKKNDTFGSALELKLPTPGSEKLVVRIEYETSPKCAALQWMQPEQTAGKKHPYVYSQCQAIHARSLLPCQDTPSVKAPYSATITAPQELKVLMGAVHDGEEMSENPSMKNFTFIQKIPIPSYLIALVVGSLESRRIGPRSHIWCEKEFLDIAAEEFSETEQMLATAEELFGEYMWGKYDLLVMPPSFPFGGMENPCLTFVTPTLLAGDKSLTHVITHEIGHSWTGNLVTNSSFEHFWLNEGYTELLTVKILARIYGKPLADLCAIRKWKDLQYHVDTEGENHPFTKLVPDLKGVDPDAAFSDVPYEKGLALLLYLETLLGGPDVFDKFLRDYISEFKYKSLDTNTWKSYLYKYFSEKEDILNSVDWTAWFFGTGMPPVKPAYDESLLKESKALSESWLKAEESQLAQFTPNDISGLSSNQIIEFLTMLIEKNSFSIPKLEKMDAVYKISEKMNAEIRFRWIRLGLITRWKLIIPRAVKFITEQNRLLYIKPIYDDMFKWEETRELAISTYRKHSGEMMHMTSASVASTLQLSNKDV